MIAGGFEESTEPVAVQAAIPDAGFRPLPLQGRVREMSLGAAPARGGCERCLPLTFTYDGLNRIASVATAGNDCSWRGTATDDYGNSFTTDAWGNLTQTAITKCVAQSGGEAVDSRSQFVAGAKCVAGQDPIQCRYDAAGNLTQNGAYVYDAESRLVSSAGATYTYDGDGGRVQKSSGTTYWGGAGTDALSESDVAGNIISDYIFFNGKRIARRADGTTYYYVADHLGSTTMLVRQDGTICFGADYDPYGNEISSSNSCNEH
jgi:hypothetical protein